MKDDEQGKSQLQEAWEDVPLPGESPALEADVN
jgi:hypothetical protein